LDLQAGDDLQNTFTGLFTTSARDPYVSELRRMSAYTSTSRPFATSGLGPAARGLIPRRALGPHGFVLPARTKSTTGVSRRSSSADRCDERRWQPSHPTAQALLRYSTRSPYRFDGWLEV